MSGYSTSLEYVTYAVNYKLDEQHDRDVRKKILVFLIAGLSMKVDTAKITGENMCGIKTKLLGKRLWVEVEEITSQLHRNILGTENYAQS
jgi:hypothetical protein